MELVRDLFEVVFVREDDGVNGCVIGSEEYWKWSVGSLLPLADYLLGEW